MIKFAHICPTFYLSQFSQFNTAHLILAHLVESCSTYRDFYSTLNTSFPKIMDNSAFEMWKQKKPMYQSDKLIQMGKACNAEYIVMSDYPAEPWKKTAEAAEKLIPSIKEAGFKTFYVPQAELGCVDDLLDSIEWGIDAGVDLIGLSILSTPNAFDVSHSNRLQRYLSRREIFRLLKERRPVDDHTIKKFHCLGMVDGPKEVELLTEFHPYIYSWDSSAAIWAGIHNLHFDTSPTGLIDGKFEKEVDFSYNKVLTSQQKESIICNINYINDLIK